MRLVTYHDLYYIDENDLNDSEIYLDGEMQSNYGKSSLEIIKFYNYIADCVLHETAFSSDENREKFLWYISVRYYIDAMLFLVGSNMIPKKLMPLIESYVSTIVAIGIEVIVLDE